MSEVSSPAAPATPATPSAPAAPASTSGSLASTPAAPAVTTETVNPGSWTAGFNDDLKGYVGNKGFKDPAALADHFDAEAKRVACLFDARNGTPHFARQVEAARSLSEFVRPYPLRGTPSG